MNETEDMSETEHPNPHFYPLPGEIVGNRLDKLEATLESLITLIKDSNSTALNLGMTTPNAKETTDELSTGSSESYSVPTVLIKNKYINNDRPTMAASVLTSARKRGSEADVMRPNYVFTQGQIEFQPTYKFWGICEYFKMQQDLELHLAQGQQAKFVNLYNHISGTSSSSGVSPQQAFLSKLREMLATLLENPEHIAHPYSREMLHQCPSHDELRFMREDDFMVYAEISVLPRNEAEISRQLKHVIDKYGPSQSVTKVKDYPHFHSCFIQLTKYVKLTLVLSSYSVYGSQEQITEEERLHFPIKIPHSQKRGYAGFQELLQNRMKLLNLGSFFSEIEARVWAQHKDRPKTIEQYLAKLTHYIHEAYKAAIKYKPYDDAIARDQSQPAKDARPSNNRIPSLPKPIQHVTVLQQPITSDLHDMAQILTNLHDVADEDRDNNDDLNICEHCFTAMQSASSSPGCYAELFFGQCVNDKCQWSHGKRDLQALAKKTIERWQNTLLKSEHPSK